MLCPDGKRLNINRQYMIQSDLLKQYQANTNCLRLTVDMKIYKYRSLAIIYKKETPIIKSAFP